MNLNNYCGTYCEQTHYSASSWLIVFRSVFWFSRTFPVKTRYPLLSISLGTRYPLLSISLGTRYPLLSIRLGTRYPLLSISLGTRYPLLSMSRIDPAIQTFSSVYKAAKRCGFVLERTFSLASKITERKHFSRRNLNLAGRLRNRF